MRLFACLLFVLGAASQVAIAEPNYSVITVAKGGTHLLRRCLNLFAKKNPKFEEAQGTDLYTHSVFAFSSRPHYLPKQEKLIVLIRDPRDVCVSLANWYTELLTDVEQKKAIHQVFAQNVQATSIFSDIGLIDDYQEKWISFSMEQRLLVLTNALYPPPFTGFYTDIKTLAFLIDYLKKSNTPVHICRFEDLVGLRGGGNNQAQFRAVQCLAEYLGVKLSVEDVQDVASKLFGRTWTFRKGQIGAWRENFTPRVKQCFCTNYQVILQDWGYETDENWAK